MTFAGNIIFSDPADADKAAAYEASLEERPIGERIKDCQRFAEDTDETSIAKLFLLALTGDQQTIREIRRIVAWKHAKEKARFFIAQLSSQNEKMVIEAVNLLGALKQPFSIPYLGEVLDPEHVELSKAVVSAISEMDEPLGARIIRRALTSPNDELVLLSVRKLSAWIEFAPWKVFAPLVLHKDSDVRTEAAFAIALRKNHRSASFLFEAIRREKVRVARISMIRFVGMIPRGASLMPLLRIAAHDEDQKARLTASRTADRLQGLLKPQRLFRLRYARDMDIRNEVLFRIGKFGSEIERHKGYLRKTLKESKDQKNTQACLMALGFIAEHKDMDLLMNYLSADPLTSYIAALALTRIWRLDDVNVVLKALAESSSSLQRQIFLTFLIRRRGFYADPEILFTTIKNILDKDENVNVRYLAFCLFEFAPTPMTIEYLLSSYEKTENVNDRNAIDMAVKNIAAHHSEYVLPALKECDARKTCYIMSHVPENADPAFYRSMAKIIFSKYNAASKDGSVMEHCREALKEIVTVPRALAAAVKILPNAEWKKLFFGALIEHGDKEKIAMIKDDLVYMLKDEDPEVAGQAMLFIVSLRDPSVIPGIVSVAELDVRPDVRALAQNVVRSFVRQGII